MKHIHRDAIFWYTASRCTSGLCAPTTDGPLEGVVVHYYEEAVKVNDFFTHGLFDLCSRPSTISRALKKELRDEPFKG